MSHRKFTASRVVILGLSIGPLGAQAVLADSVPAEARVDLSGLVAGDFTSESLADPLLRKAVSLMQEDPAGCDPSGCGPANYQLNGITLHATDQGYGNLRAASASVTRYSGQLTDLRVDMSLESSSDATIVYAPGCVVVNPKSVQCPVGDIPLSSYNRRVATIVIAPGGATQQFWITGQLRSASSPNPNVGSAASSNIYQNSAQSVLSRFTRLEQVNCPLASASVAVVRASGEVVDLTGYSSRLLEDGTFVSTNMNIATSPLSLVLMVDDSAAASSATWASMKAAANAFVQDWVSWASIKGMPMPAIAIRGMASNAEIATFSTDQSVLAAAIAAAPQVARGTHFYASVGAAGNDLSTRAGRRAVLILGTGADAGGSVSAESTKASLSNQQVNVYGIAVNPRMEPMLRDIAAATDGFRQRADLDGGVYSAIVKINSQMRGIREIEWTSPYGLSSYRSVNFSAQPSGQSISITDGYTPSANCAAQCRVVRNLEGGHIAGAFVPVNLIATPSATQSTTISEVIADNGQVSAISHGGVYDSSSRMIYWDIPPGTAPINLSYRIASQSYSQLRFAGFASHGGALYSTCGDALQSPWLNYPGAPSSYSSGYISSADLERYASAWFLGVEPVLSNYTLVNPRIRMAYVTRGYQLLRSSQPGTIAYVYVSSSAVPWTSPNVPAATVQSLHRSLPATLPVGVPFDVTLTYTPSDMQGAGAIEEVPPAGWAISNISDGGYYDALARTIRWDVVSGVSSRSVSYTLTPPAGASPAAIFEGRASVDGNDADFPETTFGAQPAELIFRSGFD